MIYGAHKVRLLDAVDQTLAVWRATIHTANQSRHTKLMQNTHHLLEERPRYVLIKCWICCTLYSWPQRFQDLAECLYRTVVLYIT